jgi:type I restriction enzyme, S subunit
MNKDWKKVNLGLISKEKTYGYTASASVYPVGPKFLRITDIQDEFIDWSKVPYCQIRKKENNRYKLFKKDIVIARTGNSTGSNKIIKENIDAVFASYLIRFRIDETKADPNYIAFILKSKKWFDFVEAIKGGSAQPGANANMFSTFELELPSIEIQHKISFILSSLDDKIELNLEMNKTLESMAMALYKEWFVDFGPFRDGEFVDSELGRIPKGWEIGELNEVIKIGNASIKPFEFPDEEFLHYSIPAFDEDNFPNIEKGISILSQKFYIEENSILVSKLNPRIKRIWCVHIKDSLRSVTSTEFIIFMPILSSDWSFSYQFLNGDQFFNEFITHASGTTGSRQRVSPNQALKFIIIIPKPLIREKFNKLVSPILKLIDNNNDESQELRKQRDLLLPKLLNGEIEPKL